MVKIKKASHVFSMLIESCFGSPFSYFDLQVTGVMVGEKKSTTIDLHVLVLDSSTSSIQNLFTRGNQGTLFAGCIMQNSPLLEDPLLWKLHFSKPKDLLSVSFIVLLSKALHLSDKGSPLLDGLHLYTYSSLSGAWDGTSRQHQCL